MDKEKIIEELMINDKKSKGKPVRHFCDKYGIDIWECLSLYGEGLKRQIAANA